jgi:F0F1-type ATP synthase membrane subunit b/b'
MVYFYLGPGIGGGILIVVIGVIALIVITLFTFLWFPIKRFLNKRKK